MSLWPDITFPSLILCVDFIFEVSSVISRVPTEKKTSRDSKRENKFFKNISRLRVPTGFLIADSESTQKVGSIGSL